MLIRLIIQKTVMQLVLGGALSCLYMLIRPIEAYTLAWPFAFLAAWFLLIAWLIFLKHDGVGMLNLPGTRKKQGSLGERLLKKFKNRSFIDYVDTEIETVEELEPEDHYRLKLFSNLLTAAIFFILTLVF